MATTHDPRTVAIAYIEGCARKDLDAVAPLLAPDVKFEGPGNTVTGADPLKIRTNVGAASPPARGAWLPKHGVASVMYMGVRSSVLDEGGSPSSSSLAYAAAVAAA